MLYREQDMPDAPARLELGRLRGQRFISLAASGPIGQLFTQELQRLDLELDEVVSARTFYIAARAGPSGRRDDGGRQLHRPGLTGARPRRCGR